MADRLIKFLCRYVILFVFFSSIAGYAGNKEIYIGGESTVSDLKIVLLQWDKFLSALRQYAETDEDLKTCNFDVFDIENIEAINKYSPEKVRRLFPQFAWVLDKGKSVKAIRTYAPCDHRFVGEFINWFYYDDGGSPAVFAVAVGAAMH